MSLKDTYIGKGIEWLKGSMDNMPGGASSKKLTAWGGFIIGSAITILWAIWAYLKSDWTLLPIILPMWLGLIYGALQINSSEKKKGILKDENHNESPQ